MKKILYFLIVAGCMGLQSCNDFLDEQPKGFTIPKYCEDYARLLNSQNIQYVLDKYTVYFTDDVKMGGENDGGEDGFRFVSLDDSEKNMFTFQHGQVFIPGNSDYIWEGAYSNIFTYNAVANNVMSAPDGTQIERNHLRGEALVGRAFEYLNLVNVYAKHYDPATAATDYGVPLVLSEEVGSGASYVRNSVAEVYQQILDDLTEATGLLKDKVSNSYHPTKSIAYAFLSRVYLYMGNYGEALSNANEALKLNKELLDYKLYTTVPGQWGRIVLESDMKTSMPDEGKNVESIFTRLYRNSNQLFKSVSASDELIVTYQKNLPEDAVDQRLALFFSKDKFYPSESNEEDYTGYYIYAPYLTLSCGFSTPEIYLIAAECEARVGSIDNALKHLNTLRDMRIKNNVHFENDGKMTRKEALELCLDERRRELVNLGLFRLIDLKRMNADKEYSQFFAKDVIHSVDGETWTLPANDLRYIMPVPQNVLDYSPNMPQYDR